LTETPPPDPDLTDDDAAELLAFLDNQLPAQRRAAVQARLDGDPALAAAAARRIAAASLVAAAVRETQAPHDLRVRIDALGARPQRRPRRAGLRLRLGALAGVTAVAVVALVLALGDGAQLNVRAVVAAAVRPPVATVSIDPIEPRLLRASIENVRFPNFAGKFGWRATGARSDDLEGRHTRTVFYERRHRRIAYTIVAGAALPDPGRTRPVTAGEVTLRALRAHGQTAVTWRRQGHTCVLSGSGVSTDTLVHLASWKGRGAIRF
jgi:hypothetical protein